MVNYGDHSPLGCYSATAKLKESGNDVARSYGFSKIFQASNKKIMSKPMKYGLTD